jgi:REP element-mobilizing transposase RayT
VVHHVRRERSTGLTPALVTVRVKECVPSLRKGRVIAALEASFGAACERGGFRLVHYSIQRDHLHLIVEAESHVALGNGMKSIAARIARAVNRVFRRTGACLAGRYHVRWLRSPRQLRNALRYVLLNVRKHYAQAHGAPPPVRLDPASSARWFDGWRGGGADGPTGRVVAHARSWLLRIGWKRYGLIDPAEVPG